MSRKPTISRFEHRLAERQAARELPGIARELRDALSALATTPEDVALVRRATRVLAAIPPAPRYPTTGHVTGDRGV